MIYDVPPITPHDQLVLNAVQGLKDRLKIYFHAPRRWMGLLRRTAFAKNIRASNAIEGHNISVDDALAVVEDEDTMDAAKDDWQAVSQYRQAMTYVLQLAEDPTFRYSPDLIKSLHFMMMNHTMDKDPGRWRPGGVFVYSTKDEEVVYEGPDAALVPDLIDELVAWLQREQDCPYLIKAAMAHLNLTMIHPFRDGNGRMARCLQTLVLARSGTIAPVLSSIEEYLGKNTQEYYSVLDEVGKGAWHPQNDATPWIRFCLTAHYRQAATVLRRIDDYERLFDHLGRLVKSNGLPDRATLALADAAMGFRVRSGTYRKAAEITQQVASRDLKEMVDREMLAPFGEKRGRYYLAGPLVQLLRSELRQPNKKIQDPYEIELTPDPQISLLEEDD